ncbi:MAG: thioredoxin 1 [Candidatus Azotimanducaceae bacterium]|jgi:thioredoxin 1
MASFGPFLKYFLRPYLLAGMAIVLLTGCSQESDSRYDPHADARQSFEQARLTAVQNERYLMVVFGADWCPDCLKLHDNLKSSEVSSYMREHMDFITVDVGERDRNLALANELGVTIDRGIPVAVFFKPDGTPLGTTNDGQLEPSRHFTSRQILRFVKAVVEHSQISSPIVKTRAKDPTS